MTEIRLTLPGSIKSKKNSKRIIMIGGKNVPRRPLIVPSEAYKKWEDEARASLWKKAIIPPLACPIHIEAHFYFKGPQPDLSGAMESLADALEGVIYADDKQIVSWDGSRMHHDILNPRTEVAIKKFTQNSDGTKAGGF